MWPIVGHRQAVNILKNGILSRHLAHAYLFIGPPHVGKSTVAKVFAQALNCDQLGEPCGQCRSCRLIAGNRHHDVQIVQAGGDGGEDGRELEAGEARAPRRSAASIGIEQIRALQRDAALAPYEARNKVYIVLDAENMTVEAANCLLKTLEEPPERVILILTSADAKMLLPTVVSRCQQVTLRPLPRALVEQALKDGWKVGEEEADRLARLSRGCLGWAVTAATNPRVLASREAQLERMVAAVQASRVQRFSLVEKLVTEFSGNQSGLQAVLGLWLEWWRDVLLVKIGCQDMVANVDLADGLQAIAARLSLQDIYSFARELESTMRHLEVNANARLVLEALMLRVPADQAVATGRWR